MRLFSKRESEGFLYSTSLQLRTVRVETLLSYLRGTPAIRLTIRIHIVNKFIRFSTKLGLKQTRKLNRAKTETGVDFKVKVILTHGTSLVSVAMFPWQD